MTLVYFLYIITVTLLKPIYLIIARIGAMLGNKSIYLAAFARERNLEGLRYLISKGYNMNHKNVLRQTPLHVFFADTLENSHNPYMIMETLRYIIDQGVDINAVDYAGYTALISSISGYYSEAAKYLIDCEGILLNKRTPNRRTALHFAVCVNNIELVYYLLKKGADPNLRDRQGLRPIDLCQSTEVMNCFSLAS